MDRELRILILEDNPDDLNLLVYRLRSLGFAFEWENVADQESYLSALEQNFDLILADYRLPGFDGVTAVRLLRERNLDTPFIAITGTIGDELAAEMMREGADDYLLKDRLGRLADAMRGALERAETRRELERRMRHLTLVNEVAADIVNSLDADEVIRRGAIQIQRSFGYEHVGIFILEGERLVMRGGAGSYIGLFPENHSLAVDQGLIGSAFQSGSPILIDDVQTDERFYNPFTEHITRSEAAIPIKAGEESLGVLDVQSKSVRAFSATDLLALNTLADQIAIALTNARLYSLATEQRLFAEALADNAAAVNSILNLNEILGKLLDNVMRVIPCENASVFLTEGDLARVVEHRGYSEANLKDWIEALRLPLAETFTLKTMASTKKPLVIADVRQEPDWADLGRLEELYSFLGAPIVVGGAAIGFITLDGRTIGHFSESQGEQLQAFADHAAVAIQNAHLFEELSVLVEELAGQKSMLEVAVQERTQELVKSRNRIAAILNSTGEAVIVFDLHGRVINTNPALETLTGYTMVEIEGRHFSDILQGINLADTIQTVQAGKMWRGELQLPRKDGSFFDAALTVNPFLNDEGEEAGYVGVMRDVTPLKEVARMKDAFVSNVSHELRTPITGMKLNHRLLTMDKAGADKYIDRLGREIDRLNILIEDLLRLSRLDQERVELDLTPTDLNAVAATYVQDREPIAESVGLSLRFEPAPALPPVLVDEGLLGQALSVLLTNAMNYTPSGGQIVVRTGREQGRGQRRAEISVSDSGPGISPQEQSQLFERFFRGSVGRASAVPGTGLGLPIALEIMNRHQGGIEVESAGQPGKGATFTLWLPLTGERRQ